MNIQKGRHSASTQEGGGNDAERDCNTNHNCFQASRKFPDSSTETDFKIPIKAAVREKLEVIAQAEGTNPICLGVLAIAHLITQKWNWKENQPKQKRSVKVVLGGENR